jgi:hypothetical protein
MKLTREHIELTLGVKLPLNEGAVILDKNLNSIILSEQILYESFLNSLITYGKDKWDKTVSTINDWKDVAVILGKVIVNPKTLENFSSDFWKTFKSGSLVRLRQLIQKLKLDSFIPKLDSLINKITSLQGWKKFIAAVSVGAITNYILANTSKISTDGLSKWLKSYFSEEILNVILDKLTDFTSYLGWLEPIIKGTKIIFDTLKPTIDKFKTAFDISNKFNTQTTENKIKKLELKQIIKEELRKLRNDDNG